MTSDIGSTPPRIGSRVCEESLWHQAREDFQRGDSAASVCERYDLGKSTFWARAALEGWRRSDQPDQQLVVPIQGDPNDLTGNDLANIARTRLSYALASGRSSEVVGWLKAYKGLLSAAQRDDLF